MRAVNPPRALAALAVVAVLQVSGSALAEDGFVLLDRQATHTGIGADVSVGTVSGALQSGFVVLRLDSHGEILSRSKRIAAVFTVPLSVVSQDGANELVFGNLEGGVLTHMVSRNGLNAVARVTLALPTASGSTGGALANGVAAIARVNDLALAMPETMSARSTGSVIFAPGGFFVRADVGIDVPLFESSSRIDELSRVPLFRVNLALGTVTRSGIQLSLESANTLATEDAIAASGFADARTTIHQLGGSARIRMKDMSILGGLFIDPSTMFEADDGFSVQAVVGVTRSL